MRNHTGKLFPQAAFCKNIPDAKQVLATHLVCGDLKMTEFRVWRIAGKVSSRVATLGFRTGEFVLFGQLLSQIPQQADVKRKWWRLIFKDNLLRTRNNPPHHAGRPRVSAESLPG